MKVDSDLADDVRGKWFEPILNRIEAFENTLEGFEDILSATEPGSPEWAVQCVVKSVKPFGKVMGMPFDGTFTAENVGALIGAKASICTAMAASHKIAQDWTPDTRAKFVDAWGTKETRKAEISWKAFAEKLQPAFEVIRRFAVETAMKQGYFEDINFHRGLAKGLTFMQELRKKVRKAVTKAERDAQNRAAVYFFAVYNAREIEAKRKDLSWPELAQNFEKAFDDKLTVAEDTLKKILQRCGLTVGKPGRSQ
jgi:hypothetical protein